jgi:DNA-3-methyladenine glycosylase
MSLISLSRLSADGAARRLLGALLVRSLGKQVLVARIVEVEAYDEHDPASHSYHGRSARNQAMFGPAGRAYIYNIYGLHQCFNVTCGRKGFGAGVLIRAAEPVEGLAWIRRQRPKARHDLQLLSGPARLTQGLAIGMPLYGHDLRKSPLRCEMARRVPERIRATRRIGISKAVSKKRRFYLEGSPHVSRPEVG